MKIKVIRADGRTEILTMVPPIVAECESESGYFRLACSDGTGHFFNGDGTYDGWDRKVDWPISTPQQSIDRILEIDSQREIDGGPKEST